MVEMELNEDKVIIIRKKIHPLEIEDNLFEGVSPFTDKEMEEAKKSLFPQYRTNEIFKPQCIYFP